MAFLNTAFLVSFSYFDVRVLTIALYLCAYILHLEAQLICCILSLKLYYFSFDIFYLFFFFLTLKQFRVFMLIFCYFFCTNRNKSNQVLFL